MLCSGTMKCKYDFLFIGSNLGYFGEIAGKCIFKPETYSWREAAMEDEAISENVQLQL